MVLYRLKQLPRLAGRAHDDALPVLLQQALGNDGHPLEILQVGGGNHLVEVFQAHLVPGQEDDVFRKAVGLPPQGAQLLHLRVDGLERADALFPEHLPKRDQHIPHRGRVVAGPVMIERGQVQVVRHDIQLVLSQARQQVLGQDQGVDISRPEIQSRLGAAFADKADVKLRVVSRQRPAVYEFQKLLQCLGRLGRVFEHLVGNTRETDNLRRQPLPRVHKGLEPLGNFPVPQHHRADFRDGFPVHLQPGGLDVEADDIPLQGNILRAMNGDAVVHVVDEIALHAVEDLDLVPGGVPGIREGLGHAVVRDGNGGMAPADGLLDHLFRVREGIHIAHLRVQVQLHALYRSGVLPLLMVDELDVLGVELNVLAVPGGFHLSLNRQPQSGLYGALQGPGLPGRQVLLNADGTGPVRHIKAEPP